MSFIFLPPNPESDLNGLRITLEDANSDNLFLVQYSHEANMYKEIGAMLQEEETAEDMETDNPDPESSRRNLVNEEDITYSIVFQETYSEVEIVADPELYSYYLIIYPGTDDFGYRIKAEAIEYDYETGSSMPGWAIALVVLACIGIILLVAAIVLLIICLVKGKKGETSQGRVNFEKSGEMTKRPIVHQES